MRGVGKERLPVPDPARDKVKSRPRAKDPSSGSNRARLALADLNDGPTPWMPTPETKVDLEGATANRIGAKPEAMQMSASTGAGRDDAGAQRFWYRDAVGVSGPRGTIASRTNIELVVGDEPRSALSYPAEIKGPPRRVDLYPVQIRYAREIDFLDAGGRTIHVTASMSIGMEHDQFTRQLGLGDAAPTFGQLMALTGDSSTAALYVDGLAPGGATYFGTADVSGAGGSMGSLLPQLHLQITGPYGLLDVVGYGLANPGTATWEQFEEIVRFARATDAAAREQREIDEEKAKPHHNAVSRFFLAAGGAIVSLGEGMEQAVLNIADAGRLLVAMGGKASGAFDYQPNMWGDVGKAKEANPKLSSSDVAKGIVTSIKDLPKHAIEDLENDDPYQFGKDAMNIYMFAKGSYETAKGVGGLAFNFGVRGLSKLGTRGFKMAYSIRSWQAARAFGRATSDIKFPEGMEPTVDYDPHLRTEAQYNPKTRTLSIGEKAFTPRWRSFFPRPGGMKVPTLRGRLGIPLRGGFLDMAVHHETWHAFQHIFDPANPNWFNDTAAPYLQNSLEFTQPGAKQPGAWDKMLDAPAGPFAKGIGSLAMAPGMYKPQPSDQEQRAVLQLLAGAQRITTTDEFAKLGDLPIIAVIAGNGRVLLDDDALEAGAWFLVGDEKKQYAVPAYLMKADR